MKKYDINVQRFKMADNPSEAKQAVDELGVDEIVLKAQILAGGRGKGVFSSGLQGGVKVTKEYVTLWVLIGWFLTCKSCQGSVLPT